MLYRGHGKGETFGPSYTSGDIVGGGINYASQEFFFTYDMLSNDPLYKNVNLCPLLYFLNTYWARIACYLCALPLKDVKA